MADGFRGDDGIVLGPTQYGKSEIRLVHIARDTPRHVIRDLTVTTTLRGRFTDSYVTGDQAGQLPTDSQKNTVYAYARRYGIGAIEDFGLRLARHFVDDIESNTGARVQVEEYAWDRIDAGDGGGGDGGDSGGSGGDSGGDFGGADSSGGSGGVSNGAGHDHSFVRSGGGVRTARVTVDESGDGGGASGAGGTGRRSTVVAGIRDLVLLKSTGSEYRGYVKDPFTTLAETTDRVLATSLEATWRYRAGVEDDEPDWDGMFRQARSTLLATFATLYSKALQHTLWHMGRDVLERMPEIEAIHLSAPNKHHFLVDLEPFGLDNPGEVFYASDRPYGMIEATVLRDGVSADLGWP